MKHPFRDDIVRRVLMCDGAMGTRLHERGISYESSLDGLCLTHPDVVKAIHQEYIDAGADVIETNTFGANRYRLHAHGLADQVPEINRTAVQLARHARDEMGREVYVAGAIGPTGQRLYPLGKASADDLKAVFTEQVEGLLAGGVDLFILETFYNINEICLAVEAVRESSDLPIVAQMTFTSEGVTPAGYTPEECARRLSEYNIDLLGANCSVGPQLLIPVLEHMRTETDLPLSVQPNASLPKYVEGRYIYHVSPDYFAETSEQFLPLNVRLIGGCCGTTPEHIKALAVMVKKKRSLIETDVTALFLPDEVGVRERYHRTKADRSAFVQALDERFVVSVEIDPPRGSNPENILKAAGMLEELGVDAVNIADSPMARVRMGALAAAALIVQCTNLEVILHMTCRDRNLMGLQSDLLGAHALGIRNILALTGDPVQSGNYPNITSVYDVDSIGLLQVINALNRGEDTAGNSIGSPTVLTAGVAVNPASDNIAREIDRFHRKEAFHPAFAMTQPIYDKAALEHFLDTVGNTDVKVIAGILPLLSYRHANFMHHEVPGIIVPEDVREKLKAAGENAADVSIELTVALLEQIRPMVAGVYFMPSFGRYTIIAEIIRQSGLAAGISAPVKTPAGSIS
ncbi:MAG: bifunctional homocysteine S-methyltransferase/methylenetetrahydrofolate reductase [candidate division Zixibacteria bacterium]|nr:bifunctional homocysteine S-methyltransferase/methylenetetrahydrofolate reductase [candidate division Zixibacteria bacterium]